MEMEMIDKVAEEVAIEGMAGWYNSTMLAREDCQPESSTDLFLG
jgi:hypothetical protein